MHRTYVSDLERGARSPTITVVEKLAVALGVSASRLLQEPQGDGPATEKTADSS